MTFTKFRVMFYCASCQVEMDYDEWPSHYRTTAHRKAIRARARRDERRIHAKALRLLGLKQ